LHAGLFGDSGLDGGGYFYDQRHLCCRAEVQSGAHLLGIHYFRGFYRLSGAVGCGPHGAPLGIVDERRKGGPVASIDNPNPTEAGHRANLGRGRTTPRPGRRNCNHLRLERSHPTANCPIGHASGSGANRVHSHRAPARPAVAHQVRSRRAWTITGSPVPMPPRLGLGQTPGSRCAFPSPWQKINAQ